MVCVPEEDIEVVISGIGGYFPRSKNVEELTKLLMDHEDGIDTARWKTDTLDVCDKTGNSDQINLFDSSFFGIHRQQALFMDPMARMVLQNTLEALIDAGASPSTVRGRRVLVAAASSLSENDSLMFENVENGFGVTGQARAMMANRISYWLNTTGPSYSCDASWLGGLQVLQHGYDVIRTGQCEAAIVVAANLVMNIYTTYHFKQFNVASTDGTTRAFDDNADGYGRSDGLCVLFLQRSDQARRKYATVVNVETIFNGYRDGYFVDINPDSARDFLTNFYQRSGVDPSQVSYLETNGAAIKKLDTIELNVVDQVFNNGNREQPLMIGSVKTNIGHSEASAALASIVKTIIAMENDTIPANLHYNTPNSEVPALTEGRLKVVTENTPWYGQYAAINGFGVASSYGHALLRKNTIEKQPDAEELAKKLPLLHIVSTRTGDGIKEIVDQITERKVLNLDFVNMINGTFTSHIPGYLYRGYVMRNGDTAKSEVINYGGINRPVWFVYSGMGSQWLTMGKQLLGLPVFARAMEKCVEALKPFNIDLMQILTSDEKAIFDNILHSFVGIAAVQIGLTDFLFSLGISPDGMVGHSVGELGCAYADGCITAEQMILSAYYRGRASLEADLIPGLMAAVGVGATEATKYLKETPSVDIACHNGPDSCTLSGPKEDMEQLVQKLQNLGIFARLVNVAGIAYHSRYIRPAAPFLLNYLQKLIPQPKERSSKWLSTSVPEAKWDTELARLVSADYLTNNLLSSVCFEETLKHIPKEAVLIEIAPHGLLQAILKRSVDQESVNIPLTKRGEENGMEYLFTAIGKMYLAGVPMNLSSLYEDIYPSTAIVPRGTPCLAPIVRWAHLGEWRTGINEFLDCSSSEQTYPIDTHSVWCRDVLDHKVHNTCLIPVTAYLPLVCSLIANTKKADTVEFLDLSVKRHRNIRLKDVYIPPVKIMVQRGTGSFEISDRYGIIANGQSAVPDSHQMPLLIQEITEGHVKHDLGEKLYKLTGHDIYRELATRGLELRGAYKSIAELQIYKNGIEASIIWKNNWSAFMTSVLHTRLLHPDSSPRCLIPGFVRRMIINFDALPQEGTVIQMRYTRSTDTFWSQVMLLQGSMCIAPVNINRSVVVALKTMFLPQEVKNNEEIDVAMIVDASLEIVRTQLEGHARDVHMVLCNDLITRKVRDIIKETVKQNSASQVQLHVCNSLTSSEATSLATADLVVISPDHLKSVSQYLPNHPKCHVLVCSDRNSQNESDLIEILSYQRNGYYMRLLKKMCNEDVDVLNVNENVIKDEDIENTSISWVRDLQEKLSTSNKRIYVACRSLPTNDVHSFVTAIQNLNGGHKTRFIFVLDERAPNVTATEPFYSRIFQQNVSTAVYERGQWGSRYRSTIRLTDKDLNEDDAQNDQEDEYSLKVKVNNVDVRCIGVHASSAMPVENDKSGAVSKMGLIDYCGLKNGTNTKIMGICDASLQPDNIFQWTIPNEDWSLIDGATVPAAYTIAYYSLIELTQLKAGETILVHNGCSAAGQAIIRVAYSIGAKIFASVANERQRTLLLQHMLMLTTDTVFDYTTAKFEQQVMEATQGQGVSVLINCIRGERLRAGLRCVSDLGRAVLLQDETDPNAGPNTDTIGLSTFFRCVGMYGLHPARLCDLNENTKQRVHQLVQEGLNKGYVVPIRRNIFRHQQHIEQIIRYVTGPQVTGCAVIPIQEDNLQTPQKPGFHCSSSSTYVVYGDDNSDIGTICMTLSWLVRHGAKKILLKYDITNNEERAFLQRNLQGLHVSVEMTRTLPAPEKLKNVAAVIVLPGVKVIAANAVPAGIRLVIITGTSSPWTLQLPAHPLRSTLTRSKKIQYSNILNCLGHALSKTVDVMVLGDENDGEQIVEENFTYKDFFRILGASVPSVSAVKTKTVDDVTFELVNTSSPRRAMDSPPVFVVPGLLGAKCKYLQQTMTRILSPAYVINAQHNNLKIEQLSAVIAQRIREVYPKGPYGVIGISTGGILALEIIKHLEEAVGSTNVQLFLIDAAPATIQHLMNEAQTSNLGLDGLILQNLLRIVQPEVINELIASNKTWQSRLNAALDLFDFSRDEVQTISQKINMTRNNVTKILNYAPNEQIINAPVRLLRPSICSKDRSNILLKTCKQMKVEVVKGNHFTMLQSQKLTDYINENLIMNNIYS